MVFANLTYEDKQAFFSLLDEYFESRPHLVGGDGSGSSAGGIVIKPEQAMAAASTAASLYNRNAGSSSGSGSRTLPPLAPATSNNTTPPYSPSTPDSHSHSPASRENAGQKTLNTASRFVSSGMNKVTSNSHVSSALGKVGAGNLASKFNKPAAPNPSYAGASADRERTLPPPAPASRGGGGAAGLTSGRSFGHVDTSSAGAAVKTMFRDPKKVTTPTVEHHLQPALGTPRNNLPPPVRRDGTGSAAASAASLLPQAIALYDYAGSDETDLAVHENQTVTIVNKTSDDWWTCEDDEGKQGLVPANYLKEL